MSRSSQKINREEMAKKRGDIRGSDGDQRAFSLGYLDGGSRSLLLPDQIRPFFFADHLVARWSSSRKTDRKGPFKAQEEPW